MFLPVFVFGMLAGLIYALFQRLIRHAEIRIPVVVVSFWLGLFLFERSWANFIGGGFQMVALKVGSYSFPREQAATMTGIASGSWALVNYILLQFLAEALILGSVGSLIGVAVGVGIPLLIRMFVSRVSIEISPLSAVLAFAFSSAVTLLFGVVPAYRAAQLNPTEALRYE